MKLFNAAFFSLILLSISGCASMENRLSLTIAGDRLLVNSMVGPVGVTTEISDKDRDALLNAVRK